MSEGKAHSSPAAAVLVTVLVLGVVVVVLAWPAPRLCYEHLTGTPAVSDVCHPAGWIRRAAARLVGG